MCRKALRLLVALLLFAAGEIAAQIGAPCDASIWDHVHSPGRFRIINPCIAVRGTVEKAGRNFYDGDAVFGIRPDNESAFALRKLDPELDDRRIKKHGGLLRLEIICARPKIKFWACRGYKNAIRLPKVGDVIVASGPYVEDGHKRPEIHGPTDVTIEKPKSAHPSRPR